ncbi:MAG: N-acetylmuramoyl-L-alanine amidase [Deltaproteobacteria bacterium]|nr:MAG: N-acetylmuramoyl-L-alanine amidase [Deltaproteobacteria bacterium]
MSRGRRALRRLPVLAVAALSLGVQRPPGLGDVREVRHWSYPDYTRVVVELSRPVAEAEVRRLGSDAGSDRPERLYLDMPGIWVGRRYADGIPVGDGLLRGVRLGQNTLRKARVVIDLENFDHYRFLRLSEPDRLVIDVFGARHRKPDGPAPGPPSARGLPQVAGLADTVVLDPGHGGRDPGAIGVGGLREKDVTLRLARILRPRLEARGFAVVLTRNHDETVDLEERTAIAEGAGGDLFVSLHMNAAPRRDVRGIETYYLDESAERQSLRVAARENGTSPSKVDALQRTITELYLSEVSNESAALANLVQTEMVRGLAARYARVDDLGVKKGPFYVLFLAHMPSILIEVGFLTHREEARRLRDDAYLELVAERIAAGVERYRERVTPVMARGGAS